MKDKCAEHKQEGQATRRMTKGLKCVKHGQGGWEDGQQGWATRDLVNTSKEGWARRVGGYEVVQVMSMITYITIIYFM